MMNKNQNNNQHATNAQKNIPETTAFIEERLQDNTPTTVGVSYASQASVSFGNFVDTIAALRRPDGCPWDREQTHKSIASNMIEEAYEAVDAIEKGEVAHLREELGDVLLQVVLQSQIAADAGEFTIDDVCRDVDEKMIRRHPHVFGNEQVADANGVLDLWDKVKLAERQNAASSAAPSSSAGVTAGDENITSVATEMPTSAVINGSAKAAGGAIGLQQPEGLLDGVPVSFPALMQAQKISRKAVSAGFEWDTVDHVWEKVREEEQELKEAYAAAPKSENGKMLKTTPEYEAAELEMGDVLFSLVNVARKMGIDAEAALRATCMKFRKRWAAMEADAFEQGVGLENLPMEELQALWDKAKSRQ
jgi:uncharacterized protein YabN with tetrapyrrole methylase and pyrophosphatase domain